MRIFEYIGLDFTRARAAYCKACDIVEGVTQVEIAACHAPDDPNTPQNE